MPQTNWTYTNSFGQNFNIGLYHGKSSGHILLHCNRSIVLIDFSIKSHKTYSFFIGEEFIELTIDKNNITDPDIPYTYSLKINKEINTPLNVKRKLTQQKNNKLAIILGIAFFVVLAIICYFVIRASR